MAQQLGVKTNSDCEKIKCSRVLYQDSITAQRKFYRLNLVGAGETFKQHGGSYRLQVLEGARTKMKGIKANAQAEVYRLGIKKTGGFLDLMKGDENVLFILDEEKELRTGNASFSYTLNRVELVHRESTK